MMLIPASLCEGPFFYFYVESVFPLLSVSLSKHHCELQYNSFYIILCLIDHILFIDIISMIYMWKLKQFAEAIIFLCVDTNTFMLGNCCYYELSLMLDHYISKCFIELFMKVCTCVITYANSLFTCLQTIDYWLGSLHSDHVHYSIIWSKLCW